jgi:hypothetical protein
VWGKYGACRVFVGNLKEGDHLEDLSADGKVILKWVFKKWDEENNWIDLVQDKDRWRAVVNAVVNLRVP